jgi:hypothetical protein
MAHLLSSSDNIFPYSKETTTTYRKFHQRKKRRERSQQLNDQLSVKPIFTPLYDYDIIHLHRRTSMKQMYELISSAYDTQLFTIDTETDHRTCQPALIQIEFVVHDYYSRSMVLLIETGYLPSRSSILFRLIRSLLKIIFQSTNTILSWGNPINELIHFLPYQILDSNLINQLNFIDIQYYFKKWYNKTFVHQCNFPDNYTDDLSCTCPYRPYKRSHEKWSLQKAIAYTFNEFLNKCCIPPNNWIQGLDDHLHDHQISLFQSQQHHHRHRQHLIAYAVNDCLAVTKLSMVIFHNWTLNQLKQYNAQFISIY